VQAGVQFPCVPSEGSIAHREQRPANGGATAKNVTAFLVCPECLLAEHFIYLTEKELQSTLK